MKKLLGILCILFLSSCATTVEPVSQASNPAKASPDVKIIYADKDEIYFMAKLGLISGGPFEVKPKQELIQTALNHCTQYKKNSYYLYQPKNPIPWKLTIDPVFKKTYESSLSDMYDWREFYYQGNRYHAYRFVCANSSEEALKKPLSASLRFVDNYFEDYRQYHRGTLTAVEQKRFVSNEEKLENARITKAKQLKASEMLLEKKKKKIAKLEKNFKKECLNSGEYEKCLYEAERKDLDDKKALAKKLAAMPPTERHAYNCTEVFNFKKGTEKFNDCVFKLYTAELDLQKLELEKQVAEAQIKAAANSQAMAEAVANAQIASAKASRRSSDLNNSIKMMKMGSDMLSGSSSNSSSNS